MNFSYAITAAISMGAIGLGLGLLLGVAAKKFAVEVDPLVEKIREVLPGSNEGACGYAGCDGFAEALAKGEAPANGCIVGGHEVAEALSQVLGIEVKAHAKKVAVVLCGGGKKESPDIAIYQGVQSCQAAHLVGGGKACAYGCLGYGDCVRACPFDAIILSDDGLAVVDPAKCTACGLCVLACPRKLIVMAPEKSQVRILCSSKDKGSVVRKVCTVGCIACSKCVQVCPLQAITIENNLASIDYEKCDNCGLCIEVCPMNTIVKNPALMLVSSGASTL